MSRAFMFDDGGWFHCIRKNDSCMFANDDGGCTVKSCRYGLPDEQKDTGDDKTGKTDEHDDQV